MGDGLHRRAPRRGWALAALATAGCAIAIVTGPAVARAAGPPSAGKGPAYCSAYPGGTTTSPPISLDDVYACQGTTTGATYFDNPGSGYYAWQCVELSERFLWVTQGWTVSNVAYGSQVVDQGHRQHPEIAIGRPGPGSVPQPGDVISFQPTRNGFVDGTAGHTAVVVASNQGTGDFTIMSENFPDGSAGEQNLHVDLTGGHDGEVSMHGGSWTSADWLELAKPATPVHAAVALIPNGHGAGYAMDGFGNIHPFGGAPGITSCVCSWPGFDIARSIALTPNSTVSAVSGFVLDGWGGLHPFSAGSGAPPSGAWVENPPYWRGWDIARSLVMSGPDSGYVLDGYGALHPFAGGSDHPLPGVDSHGAYWPNWDIARSVALSTPTSGYVLDGYGGVHPFNGGGEPMPPNADTHGAYWPNWDIARSIALATPESGFVLDGLGGVHPFAPPGVIPPPASSPGYTGGPDPFMGLAFDPVTGTGASQERFLSDGSGGATHIWAGKRSEAHSAVALIRGGHGAGYLLDGYGNLRAFGGAAAVRSCSCSWPGWDIARAVAIAPGSTRTAATGYVLDGFGGMHPFLAGTAAAPPSGWSQAPPYWPGWDIARGLVLSSATSGYVLDGFGGVHPFAATGTAPLPGVDSHGAYWGGWDIARAIVLSGPRSGYVLDGWGGIHPFNGGGAPVPAAPAGAAYWQGWDIARSIVLVTPSTGYVLDGWGGMHPFAPAGTKPPFVAGSLPYWPGWDVYDTVGYDPVSGAGAVANIGYEDGSGETVSGFTGPTVSTPPRHRPTRREPVISVRAPRAGTATITVYSRRGRHWQRLAVVTRITVRGLNRIALPVKAGRYRLWITLRDTHHRLLLRYSRTVKLSARDTPA